MGFFPGGPWRFEDRFGVPWLITLTSPSDPTTPGESSGPSLPLVHRLVYGTFSCTGATDDRQAAVLLAVYDELTHRRLARELPRPTNDPRRLLRNFDVELRRTLLGALDGGRLRIEKIPATPWPFPDGLFPLAPVAPELDVLVPEQTPFIGLLLVDQTGRPVPNRAYRVVFPDGTTQDGTLDGQGAAMLSGTTPGTCQVSCPYAESHGQVAYEVQQGDHLSGVAQTFGFDDYTTVWNDPGNAALKSQRNDPHVLLPGDSLTVPAFQAQPRSKPTGATHTFTIVRSPLNLRLTILDLAANPVGNASVAIDGAELVTDGTGLVEATVDKMETTVQVVLPDSSFALSVGTLNPSDDTSDAGYKARLFNLGFLWDTTVDDADDEMIFALQDFQAQYQLPVTGQLDDATKAQLAQTYGC